MADLPVDPALIAQHAVRRHVWKPPARTHGGWYVACEDEACKAWWASPGPDAPTEVPAWMQATAGPSVVGTPMRVLGQKVADGVIYPPNVPSNTIDATPPKASESVPATPSESVYQSDEQERPDHG